MGALLLGLLVTGCGESGGPDDSGPAGIEDGGEPADPKGAEAIAGVELAARIEVHDDTVRIDYVLTNNSSEQVHVPNRVGRGDEYGRVAQDSNFVYATGTADGGVDLSKRVFATPDTDEMAWGHAPTVGVSTVAPGARLKESLTVPRPLERHQPWGSDYGHGKVSLPEPVERIRFCLGVLPHPLPPAAALHRVADGWEISHGNVVNAAQHLYCSEPVQP